MVAHHAMTLTAMIGGLTFNSVIIVAASVITSMEISSNFMVIRRYVQPNSTAELVNNLLFFFSFSFFRILLLLFMWYTWPMEFCSVHDRMGWGKYVGWYNMISIFGLTAMNFMWYKIMLKKFTGIICPRKNQKEVD